MKETYRRILQYLGRFIGIIGIIQLVPLVLLVFYPEEIRWLHCFAIPGILSIGVSYLANLLYPIQSEERLETHYYSLLVVCIWIVAILISAVPWLIKGGMTFTQAVFEMTSGYSTTGLSVVDVENCPHVFLFFRSLSQFIGGVGLVLIVTNFFSRRYGIHIYMAEGHTDRLMPTLMGNSRVIFAIYLGMIAIGTLAYIVAGVPAFDAVNTSIAAVSTGGFAVRADSIGAYSSFAVELITIALMLMGATTFVIHFLVLRGKWKEAFDHCELRFLVVFLPIITLLSFASLNDGPVFDRFRIALFQMVSCITTTGFATVNDFTILPAAMFSLMIFAMIIGGESESTGGGLKQYRLIVSFKGIFKIIRETIYRKGMVRPIYIRRTGRRELLERDEMLSVSSYTILYLLLFLVGSFIFTLFGYSLQDSMFEFISSLSTVGLTVGITGASAHPIILWTSILGMFFGRLEIMVIFRAILLEARDIRHKENL